MWLKLTHFWQFSYRSQWLVQTNRIFKMQPFQLQSIQFLLSSEKSFNTVRLLRFKGVQIRYKSSGSLHFVIILYIQTVFIIIAYIRAAVSLLNLISKKL